MGFEFATAARILFGPGRLKEAGAIAAALGRHALLVTGRRPERAGALTERLTAAQVQATPFAIPTEPTTHLVRAGVATAREAGCDLVIGFGGGSALDGAKAIAGLLANEGELLDYLEVVGRAQPLARPALPWIALPTTAGTGAEVTRNSVLASPEHGLKASLRSPHLLARVAIVDPELTIELPPAVSASTGLDALTQLIEPYVCRRSNPLVDALCVEGIRRCARSLHRVCTHGKDAAAREDLALASLFGGLALANAGLGAVHGFAAPIGGRFPAPHGAVCAALLPHVMEANLRALRERDGDSPAIRRYDEIGRLLTGRAQAEAADGVAWVRALCAAIDVKPLQTFGLASEHVSWLVEQAANASSMKANPVSLTPDELRATIEAAL